MTVLPSKGLYAITSAAICVDRTTLLRAVTSAVRGGAAMIQYRDKHNDLPTRERLATALLGLCREARVPLVLNDGPADWLARLGIDGVHLGERDGEIGAVRAAYPSAIVGATCGASLDRAERALSRGASYLAFGAFHRSRSKPNAPIAPLSLLQEAKSRFAIALCAIGGLTPENSVPLIAAGADYVAAIEGVFGADDIESAARDYSRLFTD